MGGTVTNWQFDAFRVDVGNARVWRGEQALKLTPKAFAVLHYLLDHASQLVTREALWREVWQGVSVTDAALNMCVIEVRKALGDNARTPRFIETVHRRGYRFIGKVASSQHSVASRENTESSSQKLEAKRFSFSTQSSALSTHNFIVGRETELARLQDCLTKAVNGERQLVFVTGEPGIGKTALVDALLAQLGVAEQEHLQHPPLLIARGYCVESYGAGEAYLPVLTALEGLCRTADRENVVALLQQHAPMWLVQLPSLLPPVEREALQRQLTGATSQRVLREFANFLTILTAKQPLVLVLEDLHWGDPSTVTLLSYLARWREPLRFLVLGSYRPAEVIQRKHPLAAVQGELIGQDLCTEIPLSFLTEAAVEDYLQQRAPDTYEITSFASTLYRHTGGHPLFMVATVEEWLTRTPASGTNGNSTAEPTPDLSNGSMPERLRQLVQVQMERLSQKERRVLEAASVAGGEFSAAEVAAALDADEVATEEQCEQLARQHQFLRPVGISEWPDGTVAARYGFRHSIYQSLWQERVKAGRWQRYHQLIGERKEVAYGDRTGAIAAELALHFEQGRDYYKAIRYLQQAAQMALTRSANAEVIAHITRGLALLKRLPDAVERIQREMDLQMTIGPALIATSAQGWAAPTVEKSYARTRELCRQAGETPRLISTLHGLRVFHTTRGEVRIAYELAQQSLRLAQGAKDDALLMWGHGGMGETLYWLGEFIAAQEHCERSIALYSKSPLLSLMWIDPKVAFLSYTAVILLLRGYPDQALTRAHETLSFAQELSHPFSLAWAINSTGRLHQSRGEAPAAQRQAEALITLATEQGFPYWLAPGTSLRGWALIQQGHEEEGLAQMEQSQAPEWITKARQERPHYLTWQVEAWRRRDYTEKGLTILSDVIARVEQSGDRAHQAELYRLKGQLTLEASGWRLETGPSPAQAPSLKPQVPSKAAREAEACFRKAIEIARKQQAKSWELRATTSLARLWRQQGKQREAHAALSKVYNWFTEGFDTKDLQEAKALLDELHG